MIDRLHVRTHNPAVVTANEVCNKFLACNGRQSTWSRRFRATQTHITGETVFLYGNPIHFSTQNRALVIAKHRMMITLTSFSYDIECAIAVWAYWAIIWERLFMRLQDAKSFDLLQPVQSTILCIIDFLNVSREGSHVTWWKSSIINNVWPKLTTFVKEIQCKCRNMD